MPDMDGYEVCRQLKAEPRTRDIPVILITASNDLEDEMSATLALVADATDFIHKPVNPQVLRQRVRTQVLMGAPWRLRLNLLYADPNFAGEYQDQIRAHLDLGYEPKDQPWSLTAYYHYNLYNQDQKRYLNNYEDRYQYFNQERLVIDPARDEQKAGLGFNWRDQDGSRYRAEFRYGECRNTGASLTSFDDVTHSLRLGYAKNFKDRNLSLDASVEAGFRYDYVTGERVFAQGYRGSLFWRPSKRLTLGAYLNDSIDP